MIRQVTLTSILGSALLAGCASSGAIRSLADQTATIAETYAAATTEFADQQSDAAASDRTRLAAFRLAASPETSETTLLRKSWELGNEDAKLKSYTAATAVSGDALLATLSAPTSSASAPARQTGVDLKAPVKTLKQIAKGADPLSQAMFLGEFGASVNTKLEELRKAAKEEADAATEAAAGAELKATSPKKPTEAN